LACLGLSKKSLISKFLVLKAPRAPVNVDKIFNYTFVFYVFICTQCATKVCFFLFLIIFDTFICQSPRINLFSRNLLILPLLLRGKLNFRFCVIFCMLSCVVVGIGVFLIF
jgi:hypothetical protein